MAPIWDFAVRLEITLSPLSLSYNLHVLHPWASLIGRLSPESASQAFCHLTLVTICYQTLVLSNARLVYDSNDECNGLGFSTTVGSWKPRLPDASKWRTGTEQLHDWGLAAYEHGSRVACATTKTALSVGQTLCEDPSKIQPSKLLASLAGSDGFAGTVATEVAKHFNVEVRPRCCTEPMSNEEYIREYKRISGAVRNRSSSNITTNPTGPEEDDVERTPCLTSYLPCGSKVDHRFSPHCSTSSICAEKCPTHLCKTCRDSRTSLVGTAPSPVDEWVVFDKPFNPEEVRKQDDLPPDHPDNPGDEVFDHEKDRAELENLIKHLKWLQAGKPQSSTTGAQISLPTIDEGGEAED